MRFSVAIRTITLFPDGEAVYNVGGGMVFDSTAEAEYQECLLKARFATGTAAGFELIETLRWEPASRLRPARTASGAALTVRRRNSALRCDRKPIGKALGIQSASACRLARPPDCLRQTARPE